MSGTIVVYVSHGFPRFCGVSTKYQVQRARRPRCTNWTAFSVNFYQSKPSINRQQNPSNVPMLELGALVGLGRLRNFAGENLIEWETWMLRLSLHLLQCLLHLVDNLDILPSILIINFRVINLDSLSLTLVIHHSGCIAALWPVEVGWH